MKKNSSTIIFIINVAILFFNGSCTKLTNVDAPFTSVNQKNIYTDPALATAVLTGIYSSLSSDNVSAFASSTESKLMSISLIGGLYSDELNLIDISGSAQDYYLNNLRPSTSTGPWTNIYNYIFRINAVVEGINNSIELSQSVKDQLMGEAKFMRAFCYFYLATLYDAAPIVVSTDFEISRLQARSSSNEIYKQIETDLQEAEQLVSDKYLLPNLSSNDPSKRFRPTKWAVRALLARTYLYQQKWELAEQKATSLIDDSNGLFSLDLDLNNVFKKSSKEAIWQLQDVIPGINSGEANFIPLTPEIPGGNSPLCFAYLSNDLMNAFEVGDERRNQWVGEQVVKQNGIPVASHYFAFKYKNGVNTSLDDECPMMFRLSEQYLIRAECRVHNNNASGALADINAIRNRAGLNTITSTGDILLQEIYEERRIELFSEWGFRWLDIKRLSKTNEIMSDISSKKGGEWSSYEVFFPIPQSEIDYGPNMKQTPGY